VLSQLFCNPVPKGVIAPNPVITTLLFIDQASLFKVDRKLLSLISFYSRRDIILVFIPGSNHLLNMKNSSEQKP
jgi:hypothetical protein